MAWHTALCRSKTIHQPHGLSSSSPPVNNPMFNDWRQQRCGFVLVQILGSRRGRFGRRVGASPSQLPPRAAVPRLIQPPQVSRPHTPSCFLAALLSGLWRPSRCRAEGVGSSNVIFQVPQFSTIAVVCIVDWPPPLDAWSPLAHRLISADLLVSLPVLVSVAADRHLLS
jgi:hypothetical protein